MNSKQLDEELRFWFAEKEIAMEEEVPYPLQTYLRDADYIVSIIRKKGTFTLAVDTKRGIAAYYKFEGQVVSNVTFIDPSDNGSNLADELSAIFAEDFAERL